MQKSLFVILVSFFTFSAVFAQKGFIKLDSENDKIKITENSYQKLSLTFNHSEIRSFSVSTEKGVFNEISIPGARFTGNIGDPKIPAYSKLIEVPFGAEISVNVKSYSIKEYKLSDFGIENPIIPAQPDVNKSEDPTLTKFHYNENAYFSKTYSEFNIADVQVKGVMRGVRIAKLSVSPVNYNPSTGTVKVYNNIELEVKFTNTDIALTEQKRQAGFSPYFAPVYKKLLNGKNVIDDHPDLTKYPVKMLILSDRMFEDALVPYIEWKTKKGIEVIINYTDEGYADVQSIKDWVQFHYDAGTPEDPAPSFCLFVGDVAQIPASQVGVNSGKQTDLYYFSQDGDYFPEMYYGRFSASNLTQLQPIIDKTLYHEQYLFADPTYLDDVTLIAGADGTWNPNVGQATVQYGTQNYFNSSYGFTNVNDYLTSYSGCYDDNKIGVSLINYTAHCSQTSWGTPNLTIPNINAMGNTNKYPLAVGNCCLSADFGYSSECIGEAWIRAENKGAVAYIGSSPSTYWFEDFYWAVGAFPIVGDNNGYVPTFEETTLGVYDAMFISDYVSVDATVFLGNLVVTEVDVEGYPQHSNPLYYWEAYNCLGDPSLVPYYTQGETNTVTHMPTLPIGMGTFTVNAEPGSYVAISKDGILHGAALVDATGSVDVPITPVTSGGNVDIVVTKPQYIPYMVTIPAASMVGPYIVVDNYINSVNYGQTVDLDISLENVGADPSAGDVNVTVTTSDANASIANGTYNYGAIAADEVTAPSTGAFSLTVADDLEDQYVVEVDISITDGTDTWEQTKTVTINAPVLEFGNLVIDDGLGGNGRLDPGEIADIIVPVLNNGNSNSPAASALLSSMSSYITIISGSASPGVINAGGSADALFTISTDPLTPIGTAVNLTVDVDAGEYDISNTFYKSVGIVLEDWETGNFASFPWSLAGNANWFITDVDPYEGTYCAQSGVITSSQTSEMEVELYVTTADNISFFRKVSSESNYDYLKFYIDGSQQEQWSGEVAWGQVTYPVTAGLHTFKWEYSKDGSVDNGSDCGWVDYIIFPPVSPPPDPANIEVNPGSLEVTLSPDNQTTQTLNISNIGEADLEFSISKYYHPTKSSKAYCPSVGGGGDEFISNVSIGSINNTSVQDNYYDYTSLATVVVPGMSYPITVTNGDPNWTSDQTGIWVDWNQNEDFLDDGVIVVSGSPGIGPYTANIVPPVDAMPGPTRMRVQIIYSATPDPCLASFSYGEVEDYTLVVDSDFSDWLTFNPVSGTVPGSDMTGIDVTYNSTDMDEGDYFADLIIASNDPVEPEVIVPCTLHVGDMAGFDLDLTVFIEGPYSSGGMATDLIAISDFPLSQPFNVAPWNYFGVEAVGSVPNPNIVDWALIELRDASSAAGATEASVIARQAGFVLYDGSVVGIDGSSTLFFDQAVTHGLYAVVYTRNHIAIMSATELASGGGMYSYDFSTGSGQVHNGSLGYSSLGDGNWGMSSGDGNADGYVNAADKSPLWENQSGKNGYLESDFNMDGESNNIDKDDFWVPNEGKNSQVPN